MDHVREHFCMALDKELTLQILEINRIPAIRLTDIKRCSYPVVGRMHGHHNGKDMVIVENEDQVREEGFDYLTNLYVIEKEYNIEIEGLSVKRIMEAIPDEMTKTEIPIRTGRFGWSWKEVESIPDKWMQMAIRALYVTGLSNGFVKIGKLADHSPIVLDINPPFERILTRFAAPELTFTMGTDAEFMLNYRGNLIPASDFFPLEGGVGCDARQIEQDSGVYALAEIRPEKAESPHELFSNMKKLLIEASERVPYDDIQFLAGSMPFSGYQCGGHLHFGMPLSLSLLRALDQYLSIPMAMIEDSRTAKRRRRTKHGGLGRYRLKPYGFEYVSLSSWLIEPDIALAILCLAKLVATHHHELPSDFLFHPLVQRAYYHGNRFYLKQLWTKIKNRLMSTSSYPEYQKELSVLFTWIEEETLLMESSDIRKNWGLETGKQPYDPGMTIQIPKQLRKKFNLHVGDSAYIRAGKSIASASIHSHPFAFRDPNAVQISQPLREVLSLPPSWCPKLFSQNGMLSLGPIIGILANPPFERQSTYFRHLCRLGTKKQMLVYVFEPKNIDWEKKVIEGTSHQGSGIFPFPDVIYDRYFTGGDYWVGDIEEIRIKLQSIYGVAFLNPPSLFKLTGDKWRCHEILCKNHAEYLPDTRQLVCPSDMIEMLNLYGEVYLKPRGGAMGKGVIRVTRQPSGIFWRNPNQATEQHLATTNELIQLLSPLQEQNSYLIQEGISRKQLYGSHVEIRVYMQKNSQKKWMRTGMIARISANGITTPDTEVNMRISKVLPSLYSNPTECEEIKGKLARVARRIVETVEEHVGSIGELAVDLCIENNDAVKVVEINSKPDNLFSIVKAFKMRNVASYRLLNYAASLAGHDPRNMDIN